MLALSKRTEAIFGAGTSRRKMRVLEAWIFLPIRRIMFSVVDPIPT